MTILYYILAGCAACICFNLLFVYVIDFRGTILGNGKNPKMCIIDEKDPEEVILLCVLLSPVSTLCFLILLALRIIIILLDRFDWLCKNTIDREYYFVKKQHRKLRPIIRGFNELLDIKRG